MDLTRDRIIEWLIKKPKVKIEFKAKILTREDKKIAKIMEDIYNWNLYNKE